MPSVPAHPEGAEHAEDLAVARACAAGDGRAVADLDRRLREVAPRALGRMRMDAVTVDELLQDVREKLLVTGRDGSPPRITTYTGRGPLDGWLRVTLARAALSRLRSAGVSESDEALIDQVVAHDPALEALRKRCAPVLARAFEEALGELPEGDRVLLRLHMIDGLTNDDLAVIYRAHRATTARRIARIRSRIFEAARERAMATLGIEASEFASLMGVVLSQLDVTLAGLLRARDEVTP